MNELKLSSILIPLGWFVVGHLVGRVLAMICRRFIAKVDPVKLSLWLLFPGLLIGRLSERISVQLHDENIYYAGLFIFGVTSVLFLQLFWGILLSFLPNSRGHEMKLLGRRIERIEENEDD